MDIGVDVVNMAQVGEKKDVDDLVHEVGVEGGVAVGSVELEGDEVFEEAVETPRLLPSAMKPEVEYGKGTEDGIVELILDSSLIAVDGNSNVGQEIEKFEEAVGSLDEAENHVEAVTDVIVEDKVVESAGEDSVDVVVEDGLREGGTEKEVTTGSLGSEGLVGDEENYGKEVAEKIDDCKEARVLNSDNEMSKNLESGDSDMLILEERPSDGKTEGGGNEKVLEGVLDTFQESESGKEALHEDGKSNNVEENKFGTENQGKNHGEPSFDPAGLGSEIQYEQVEELNDNLGKVAERHADETGEQENISADTGVVVRDTSVDLNAENQDGRNEDVNDSSADKTGVLEDLLAYFISAHNDVGEVQRDTLVDLNPKKQDGMNEQKNDSSAPLGSEHHDEISIPQNTANVLPVSVEVSNVMSEETGSLSSRSVNEKNEDFQAGMSKLKDILVDGNTEHKDFTNGEVNDSSAVFGSEHPGETNILKNTTNDLPVSVEVSTVESEIGSSSSSLNSVIERNEEMQAGPTNLKVVDQPELANENSKEESKNAQSEKEQGILPVSNLRAMDENTNAANQNTQLEKGRDIRVAPQHDSSSANSTNPATNPTLTRPAGLGRAAALLEPAPRSVQQPRVNGSVSHMQPQQNEESTNGETEEYDETREKLQMIRVKFLRLAHRLGQTPHNVVVAQVLYRLGLAEQLRGRNGGRVGAFSFDRASAMAEQLEAAGQEPLDFSCTIMVLGKTGVGKSATINSIFDEQKFGTDAFQMGTRKVQDVVGTVQGIKVRVIDTPGLLPSWSDQRHNEKILRSVKRFNKKTPPDIVLYLDRLDMQSRDLGDMPLLRTITEVFGPSIWFNAIVVLTHAASAPPDGPNGTASSYDMFVTQRTHVVQQAIRQAAGDMRLMNPVSLVENHSACRTNRAGQRVLPNGQVWKPHLLLLSFASKILAEANELLKLQNSPPGKPFATRSRAPPLPFLLSSLLQSRQQVKLPEEQLEDEDGLDDDLDESSDSEDESEYDELPPFKRLTKAQVAKLTKSQKKAYFDELEYRDNLLMKKQLKEEKKRRKMMKKMASSLNDMPSEYSEEVEEESGGAASLPVPMPDLALPASFDSDNPTHRYRFLDSTNQWLVRPVLETHGWDHDVGYEGINVEKLFVVKGKIPVSLSSQVTKDKKDSNVQMEIASSVKHGQGKATSLGFDMQTVGKDMAYTLRGETRFSNYAKNKATAGISLTQLGDTLSAGVKLEDKLIVNKRFRMVVTGGAMSGRGDVAYGGSLEAQLRDKDYPLGRSLSTLGLSIMDWHGDLAIGCNLQSQIPLGRFSNLIARANMNNRGAGQISIRINSSEQLQIALIGLVPFLCKVLGYHPLLQFGQ